MHLEVANGLLSLCPVIWAPNIKWEHQSLRGDQGNVVPGIYCRNWGSGVSGKAANMMLAP